MSGFEQSLNKVIERGKTKPQFRDRSKYLRSDPELYLEKMKEASQKGTAAAAENAKNYRIQKNFFQTELFTDIAELSKNSKYTRPEQIYNELVKKYNTEKYTKVPKGVAATKAFFKNGKFNLVDDTVHKGIKAFPTNRSDVTRTPQFLKNIIIAEMLENNTNPKSLVNVKTSEILDKFYTGKGNELSRQERLIVNRFSKKYLQSGNKIRDYLTQRGLDFSKYRATNKQIQSTADKLKTLLQNPNLDEATRERYKLAIKKLDEISREISQPLMKKYPRLFKKEKLVMEHKAATGIRNFGEYFPEEYILKASLAPRSFNQYKAKVFDGPLIDLIEQYDSAPDRATKLDIQKQIKNLYNEFNKASGGYLKDLKINFDKKGISIVDNSPSFIDLSKKQIIDNVYKNIQHHNKLASANPNALKQIKIPSNLSTTFNSGFNINLINDLFPEVKKFFKEVGGDAGKLIQKFGRTKIGKLFAAATVPLEVGFIALDAQPAIRGDIEGFKENLSETWGFIPGVSKAIGAKPFREQVASKTDDPYVLTGISQFEEQKKYNDLRNESLRLIEEIDQATQGGRLPLSGINLQKLERLRVIDNELRNITYKAGEVFDPSQKGIEAMKKGLYGVNVEREAAQKKSVLEGPRGGALPYYTNPLLDLPGQYQPDVYQQAVREFGQDFAQDISSELAEEKRKQELGLGYYRDPKNLPEIQKTILDRTYPARYGTFKDGGLAALDEYKDYDRS